jgi:membrane protein required for colicin V production
MNLLDLIVLVIVASSVIGGLMAGFARSGIGLLCSTLGVLCGFWFYWVPATWVHKFITSMMVCNVVGFFMIFTAFLALGALVGKFFAGVLKQTGLGWLDRFLGATFGFFRGALATVALVSVLLAFTPTPMPNWLVDSRVLPYAIGASHTLTNIAPQELKDALTASIREVRQIWVEQLQKGREEMEAIHLSPPKRQPQTENEKRKEKTREKERQKEEKNR